MRKLAFVWFTYKNDEHILLESVKSILKCLENNTEYTGSLHVFDDGNNEISLENQEKLQELGVNYSQTFYPRSGHLLGPKNLIGQTMAFYNVSLTKCDAIVKIDSDTMIFKLDWITPIFDNENAILIGSFKTKIDYPMGNCYCIKTIYKDNINVLKYLFRDCSTYQAWDKCFEDYEVGVRLHRLTRNPNYAIRLPSGPKGGFWLCDPDEVDIEQGKKSNVVSCGFKQSIHMNNLQEYKKQQLELMKKLNNE